MIFVGVTQKEYDFCGANLYLIAAAHCTDSLLQTFAALCT